MFNPFLTHHPRIPPAATPADHLATGLALEPEAELEQSDCDDDSCFSSEENVIATTDVPAKKNKRHTPAQLATLNAYLQEWHGWCGRDICPFNPSSLC